MQRVEFDAQVKDGVIEIPGELQNELSGDVHVVVSVKKKKEGKSFLQELIENPLDIPDFKPLTRDEIYDRKNW